MATNFFWDDLEVNIIEEYDDAGVTLADYTTEPDHFGNVISQYRGGQSSFFHYDGQGSTLALTDEAQNVTDTLAYTAFGEITERTGTTEVPFQYVGQKGYYTDGLTRQIVARRRAYEPVRARWLSVDPISPLLIDANQYRYVRNSPVLVIDPSGECCCCCVTDDFGYEWSRLLLFEEGELPTSWGHRITVRARFDVVDNPKGEGRGCRLEWWECGTKETALGQRPNVWDPAHQLDGFGSQPLSNLDEYYKSDRSWCGKAPEIFRIDEPRTRVLSPWTVKFAIRLVSEAGCPCLFSSLWLFFTQSLASDEDTRYDPISRKIVKPIAWDILPGINNQQDPKACTEQKVRSLAEG